MTILVLLIIIIPIAWVIGMIKPALYSPILKTKVTRKWLSIICGLLLLVDFIVIVTVAPPTEKSSNNNKNDSLGVIDAENSNDKQKNEENNLNTVSYEIVKTEDMSRKAMGDKSLSDYTTSELNKLPTNKRISYKIVVDNNIKTVQVKPTIDKIIIELIQKDKDIDEIILDLYSNKELVDRMYDVANAIWAPKGELGHVDATIAKKNKRDNYSVTIKIKDDLEQYLAQRNLTENKFGLNEEERRQLFKDLVAAEDKARYEADAKYSIDDAEMEQYMAVYEKNKAEYERLANIYRGKVLNQVGITNAQAEEIDDEAFKENWPLD